MFFPRTEIAFQIPPGALHPGVSSCKAVTHVSRGQRKSIQCFAAVCRRVLLHPLLSKKPKRTDGRRRVAEPGTRRRREPSDHVSRGTDALTTKSLSVTD